MHYYAFFKCAPNALRTFASQHGIQDFQVLLERFYQSQNGKFPLLYDNYTGSPEVARFRFRILPSRAPMCAIVHTGDK